jgi:RNA polymerase sigma-70 factor (ECF subfamily)
MLAVTRDRDRVPLPATDREAWDAIIRTHNHRVVVSLLALGLRPAQAHEIANDAWAKLLEKRAAGELDTMSFPGLVLAQARYLALDALRAAARERRRREGLDAIREHEVVVEPPVWSPRELQIIREAIAGCSASEQRVFRAVYDDPDAPHAKVADKVGLSVQRVRQILCDVRRTIRDRLDQEDR